MHSFIPLPWNKLQQLQGTKRQLSMEVFEGGTQHRPLSRRAGIAAHSTNATRADRQLHFGEIGIEAGISQCGLLPGLT